LPVPTNYVEFLTFGFCSAEQKSFFLCAPCMREYLVVKVHYRLGSRNC